MASNQVELHIKKRWMKPVIRELDGKEAGDAKRLILTAPSCPSIQINKRTARSVG